ncbi:MAG: Nif3-like dinuclear metal center hexameric protein [Streptococcaceae bacterium]|jgi:dinuclear metal center YbgI/SA1388 family protein|nr:Nif3-like dinuclear metal center hexameric protein [Streptococcaceae bacterium]
MKAQTLIDKFEEYCPLFLAEENDPVGLHLGTLQKDIKRVMVTLDVRSEVVEEAINKKIDLLIAKHPLIFHAAKRLDTDDPQHKMYADLLKSDIAVYVAHTNIDIVKPGLNDWFMEMLNLTNESFLKQTHEINGISYGIGRVGELSEATSLVKFAQKVKKIFSLDYLRLITKKEGALVKKIAICGGSGEKFYKEALKQNADVYITGDIYYHTAHDMIVSNLHAIDPGHYIEVVFISRLVKMFNQWKEENHWDVNVMASKENTNPFVYY